MLDTYDITAIMELMDHLNSHCSPGEGSNIAVDVTVINSDGEAIGALVYDHGVYMFNPFCCKETDAKR